MFFYYFGLLGLGLAMLAMFLISGIYNYYVAVNYYNFKFRKDTLRVLFFSIISSIIALFSIFIFDFILFNPILIILTLVSGIYSLRHLKNKIL